MSIKKRGFASLTPAKLREVSSRGGKAKTGEKGYALLSPEERSRNASEAAKKRWAAVKAARQEVQTEQSMERAQEVSSE